MSLETQRKGWSRRSFLRAAGGAAVLLTSGGLFRAVDQGVFSAGTGPAYEAWKNWNASDDEASVPMRLVRAAILAASAHNTQPWLYRVFPERIELLVDLSRNIGTIDPFLREMYISLGCAVENLVLAAEAYGYKAHVSLIEGPVEQVHVATIELAAGASSTSDLFAAIGQRRTNRTAYDKKRMVEQELLNNLEQLSSPYPNLRSVIVKPATAKAYGELIVQATEAIIHDREQARDTHRWFRQSWDQLQDRKDGPTLDATGNGWMTNLLGKLFPVSEQSANQYWYKGMREVQVPTAAAFGCILVKNRQDRRELIQTGRLWQRIQLEGVLHGLAMQPMNQIMERVDRERQLGSPGHFALKQQELVAADGYECIFAYRLGYPERAALASPRRPAEEVILPI